MLWQRELEPLQISSIKQTQLGQYKFSFNTYSYFFIALHNFLNACKWQFLSLKLFHHLFSIRMIHLDCGNLIFHFFELLVDSMYALYIIVILMLDVSVRIVGSTISASLVSLTFRVAYTAISSVLWMIVIAPFNGIKLM
jgi:hypothetical protein